MVARADRLHRSISSDIGRWTLTRAYSASLTLESATTAAGPQGRTPASPPLSPRATAVLVHRARPTLFGAPTPSPPRDMHARPRSSAFDPIAAIYLARARHHLLCDLDRLAAYSRHIAAMSAALNDVRTRHTGWAYLDSCAQTKVKDTPTPSEKRLRRLQMRLKGAASVSRPPSTTSTATLCAQQARPAVT
jgi:hypothetical protein